MKPDTIATALEALKYLRGNQTAWFTLASNKQKPSEFNARIDAAIADLTTQDGAQWTPVAYVINDHLMELHADELAVTIGQDDTALATFAWPAEGNYAVVKRTNWERTEIEELWNAIVIACGMATENYVQSDTEMRRRIGEVLSAALKKFKRTATPQPASPAPDHSIRVCNNAECGWIGYNCDTVYLDGVGGGVTSLCPNCGETTEELTPSWVRELVTASPATEEKHITGRLVNLAGTNIPVEVYRLNGQEVVTLDDVLDALAKAHPAPEGVPWDALAQVMEFVDGYVGESMTSNDVELATYDIHEWLLHERPPASQG